MEFKGKDGAGGRRVKGAVQEAMCTDPECQLCRAVKVTFGGGLKHGPECAAGSAVPSVPASYRALLERHFRDGVSTSTAHHKAVEELGRDLGVPDTGSGPYHHQVIRWMKADGDGKDRPAWARRVAFLTTTELHKMKEHAKQKLYLHPVDAEAVALLAEDTPSIIHFQRQTASDAFELVLHSPEMTARIKEAPDAPIFIDATHGTNLAGFMLAGVNILSRSGKTRPVGFMLMQTESAATYRTFLSALKGQVKEAAGIDWSPQVAITDAALSIDSALKDVLPETDHFLCVFHVLRAMLTHVGPGDLPRKCYHDLLSTVMYHFPERGGTPQDR